MSHVTVIPRENYAILQLSRGKSNPINHDFVKALRTTLRSLLDDRSVKGVVLNGNPGFFSVGLDLPELYSYDEAGFAAFWSDFMALISDMVAFDKPIVAAVTGHAPAGGCILAIGCDYRVMAEGNYKIGLNEIPVGLVVPAPIFHLYAFWIGQRLAYQYLMEGKLYQPEQAREIGLVDEVVSGDAVLQTAELKLQQYLRFNEQSWRLTKQQLKRELLKVMASISEADMKIFQAQWWSPEVRLILEQFAENLKKK